MKRGRQYVRLAVLVILLATAGAARAATPEGRWLTEDSNAVVEVYRCDGALCGRLVWFRTPLPDNPQARDIHNPAPDLRNRSLCGLVVLWRFRPDSRDRWGDGSAYDPKSGNTYSGQITMTEDGRLSLRGYIGISLLGRTEMWTRPVQPLARCSSE